MNADQDSAKDDGKLLHKEVTDRVIGVFYGVYNELGGGFLESVYQNAFALALRQGGLTIETEVPVAVFFRGVRVGDFRGADITVNSCILLELKAISTLDRVHEGQILNYLRATRFEVGLLLNFGPRPQLKRVVLANRNKIRVDPRLSAVDRSEVVG